MPSRKVASMVGKTPMKSSPSRLLGRRNRASRRLDFCLPHHWRRPRNVASDPDAGVHSKTLRKRCPHVSIPPTLKSKEDIGVGVKEHHRRRPLDGWLRSWKRAYRKFVEVTQLNEVTRCNIGVYACALENVGELRTNESQACKRSSKSYHGLRQSWEP